MDLADNIYMFWNCPYLCAFWKTSIDLIGKVYGITVPKEKLVIILRYVRIDEHGKVAIGQLLYIALLGPLLIVYK